VSSKQATVAHSNAEDEYIAAAHAARDLTWLTQLARAWQIHLHDPPHTPLARSPYELRIDNKGALDMALANGPAKRTKHIDVKHHYIQQQSSNQNLKLVQIPSADQKADIFTKPLARFQFIHNIARLNLHECATVIAGGC
jgi:hypothetical protein